jgi:hypothetical protein
MFQIAKHAEGIRGSFVRLIRLDSDDYTVIVRLAEDARLNHLYIGPDFAKAEEIFRLETEKLRIEAEDK